MLVYYKIIIVIEDSTVLRTNIPHYLMKIMKIETIEHTMKEVVFTENWVWRIQQGLQMVLTMMARVDLEI